MTNKEAIQELAKALGGEHIVSGKVNSVDEDAMTCQVTPDGSPKRFSVRLRSVIDDKDDGFIPVPKVDSYVLVGVIGNNRQGSFVMKCSALEKVLMKIGDSVFEINKDDWKVDAKQTTFNGGNNGGLIKVDALVERLNAIESKLNNHITIYLSHVHPDVLTGASGPTTSPDAAMATTTKAQLENTKVKH